MGAVDAVEWACILCGSCIQNDWIEQQICLKFWVSLNNPPLKLLRWFRGHSYGQLVIGSFIMKMCLLMYHVSSRVFWQNIKSPGDSACLQPRFGALWLLTFPKTKITLEREEISDRWWDSEKYNGTADGDWENCVRSQGAYFEGVLDVIVLCTMFLVSCIFFNKCLYFS